MRWACVHKRLLDLLVQGVHQCSIDADLRLVLHSNVTKLSSLPMSQAMSPRCMAQHSPIHGHLSWLPLIPSGHCLMLQASESPQCS